VFLDGVFGNLKEFMNDYKEWHAFVEGFCETFVFWQARHKLSGELLKDLKGEHHYYTFGRVVGFIALVVLGMIVVKVIRKRR
jgi:hypothetical protein